jgi:hypothetical protein
MTAFFFIVDRRLRIGGDGTGAGWIACSLPNLFHPKPEALQRKGS